MENTNVIPTAGKWLAGILLIGLVCLAITVIIAHWPDRMIPSGDRYKALYSYQWFRVEFAQIKDSDPAGLPVNTDSASAGAATQAKSSTPAKKISGARKKPPTYIHLNTLLFILVSAGGFLGNLIHIGGSFTAFVGSGKFVRSWILWYCVTPFLAAALAIIIYCLLRGNFLTMSNEVTNINLYGVMSLAMLTGLFTDRALIKLKEVFDVALQPKDRRTGRMQNDPTTQKPEPPKQ